MSTQQYFQASKARTHSIPEIHFNQSGHEKHLHLISLDIMRRLRYSVATSLDGYIGPHDGSTAWIAEDPSIDFAALYAEFDIFIMGRKTYEQLKIMGDQNPLRVYNSPAVIVVSKTLKQEENQEVTIVGDGFLAEIERQKGLDGKDIWLFGGGELLGACLDAGLVDTVETAIIPTLLRGGIKMVSEAAGDGTPLGQKLQLESVRKLEASGILLCVYKVIT